MEPLSGVASVIAVGQLAKGAFSVITFLSRVGSSCEQARLSDLCMQLHNLANDAKNLLNRCRDSEESHVLASLSLVVQACDDGISGIENLLRRVENTKNRSLAVRTVAQIRLISKRGQVSEIESRLKRSLDVFYTHLAIYSMSLNICGNPDVAPDHQQFNEYIQVGDAASRAVVLNQPQMLGSHPNHGTLCRGGPPVKRPAVSLVAGPFNKWHDSSSDGQISLTVEGPPMPSPVQLTVSKQPEGYSKIEYSLRAITILDESTETRLRHIFFHKDLPQLKNVLASGTVSVDSLNSRGEPLLLFAQSCWDDDAALYLAGLCNVTAQNVEVCASWRGSSDDAFRALCSRADLSDCRIEDIFRDWEDIVDLPTRLEGLLLHMRCCTSLDPRELFGSALLVEAGAWALAAHELGNRHLRGRQLASAERRVQCWEDIMRWTIRQGARLHYTDRDECSILANFVHHFHPLDAQYIIRGWLGFLASCDVDTTKYRIAEAELAKCWMPLRHWTLELVRSKDISIPIDPSGPADVEVSWSVDPDGAASMVLTEFSGLGDDAGCYNATKYGGFEEGAWECSWPFDYGRPSICRQASTMSKIHQRNDSRKRTGLKGKKHR